MHVRALIIVIGISLVVPVMARASEEEGDDPHSVGRDGYFLQFGWDAGSDRFAGVGQIGLHRSRAYEFYGVFQFAVWQSYAEKFFGLAQIGAWNVEQDLFVGVIQLGAYNEARRELYALAQVGAYNEVTRAYVGGLMIGVVNRTGDGDILGPSQFGVVNIAEDIYSILGQYGCTTRQTTTSLASSSLGSTTSPGASSAWPRWGWSIASTSTGGCCRWGWSTSPAR